MTSWPLIAIYFTVCAVLVKALAVAAQPPRATCARCGRPRERRQPGEQICRCGG